MANQRAVAISKDCELGIATQEAWIEPDVFQDEGRSGSLESGAYVCYRHSFLQSGYIYWINRQECLHRLRSNKDDLLHLSADWLSTDVQGTL